MSKKLDSRRLHLQQLHGMVEPSYQSTGSTQRHSVERSLQLATHTGGISQSLPLSYLPRIDLYVPYANSFTPSGGRVSTRSFSTVDHFGYDAFTAPTKQLVELLLGSSSCERNGVNCCSISTVSETKGNFQSHFRHRLFFLLVVVLYRYKCTVNCLQMFHVTYFSDLQSVCRTVLGDESWYILYVLKERSSVLKVKSMPTYENIPRSNT